MKKVIKGKKRKPIKKKAIKAPLVKSKIRSKIETKGDGLQPATIVACKKTVLFRVIKNKVMILNLEDQKIYEIENQGAYLWLLLDGSRTLAEALKKCREDLDVKNKSFEEMARSLVNEFFFKNLVIIRNMKKQTPPLSPALKRQFRASSLSARFQIKTTLPEAPSVYASTSTAATTPGVTGSSTGACLT